MKTILFLCAYNASRTIMAEAILNHLGAGRMRAFSAGDRAIGEVHPLTLRTLAAHGIPTDGLRSKSWEQFFGLGAPHIDFVITVCDEHHEDGGNRDRSQPVKAHWPTLYPLAGTRSETEAVEALERTYVLLHERIQALLALPLDSMSREAARAALAAIGQQAAPAG